ncbi:chemotaxis protein CheX [bacterium]|nr:chemotaxis protein CheX [bacterium]MBU1884926.1 chemotaxis protein CheX [bacterium]
MIIESLMLQMKLFLQDDMNIVIEHTEILDKDNDKVILKDYTSMIGVGGKLNLMVVISYQNSLLNELVSLFMDGEEVDPQEEEEIKESVAGEVVNTIMGLALPTFPNRGKGVTITPPITINDASNIAKHKNSKIITAIITTQFGELSVSAIGPDDIIK